MAPQRKKNTQVSKNLIQTTLFHIPSTSSSAQVHSKTRETAVSPSVFKAKGRVTESISSDEQRVSDIHFEQKEIARGPLTPDQSSHEEESIPQYSRKSVKRRRREYVSSESSSGPSLEKCSTFPEGQQKDSVVSSRKRRLVQRHKSQDQSSSNEESNLADEVDETRMLENRLRTRNKKSSFQRNLEKLKRRKYKRNGVSDDGDTEEEDAVDEEQEISTLVPFKGAKPSTDNDSLFDGEHSDSSQSSGFIIQDDGVVQLPAQFSMETHQDLSYQFKKIFQFFVHVAVQSTNHRADFMKQQLRDEEYFSVPLHMTRRKVSGLRDSLVASSVWQPKFKRLLEDYPDFALAALDFAVPSCDACHLGGRMSTLVGHVSGSPYNRLGFEKRSSKPDADEMAHKEIHLGRFCAKRTRVYHQFSHWEYSLFQTISREIEELRHTSSKQGFHRIAYVGGKDPPKDLEDADGLCDWLDERRVIEMEWQKLKDMMESARHLEINAKRGDGSD
ncbi:hypothetical protein B0H34DRAFT_695018 [Crassisporium funariophilum]|nr:hypothetical protein B0H34DRAFT_695018 [Crassisporium funariophilum]